MPELTETRVREIVDERLTEFGKADASTQLTEERVKEIVAAEFRVTKRRPFVLPKLVQKNLTKNKA